ncbi:SAR2788 family putative toxin [Bacillus mojavensis]|jgi:hypothetical protein|uniref:SAR2788 family putative toxin n=1 Tax=Bacillus mojavensis TaxID=72360 RepID=UPI002DB7CDDA|nr:SAR2788 family putative toxin [Bacillus mojavensis]MEC1625384.1 SAR2788 family putative toxin [Bacillus mojavensis]MEC1679482.1 SAR2788 family putative toxin [Bacillus mojavensis]MEC1712341.1 SAR2788 family putative toxin [Bacillus mojavensis]
MKKSLKIIAVLLVFAIIISIIPEKNVASANDENAIEVTNEDLQKALEDDGDIVDPDSVEIVENNKDTIKAEVKVQSDEFEIDEDMVGSAESLTDEDLEESYSETVTAEVDKEDATAIVTSVEKDENGKDIEKKYEVDIEEANGNDIVATFRDIDTDQVYNVNTKEAQASFAFLAPIAVVVGGALVEHLVAASLAMVIAGVTYTVYSEVSKKIKKQKKYYHYAATLNKGNGKLYIGPALSQTQAVKRLKSGDVYSLSKSKAYTVAKKAGHGKKPVGPENHRINPKTGKKRKGDYYWHYHAYKRKGGHSFY